MDRLRTAVEASLGWYEDVFAAHGVATHVDTDLWRAIGNPPRWHSAVKTLQPGVTVDQVQRACERFPRASVADSFGTLDLSTAGFQVLFRATWLHHPPLEATERLPHGWSVVSDELQLEEWNIAHDTVGVILPSLLTHPRFTILAKHVDDRLVGGAVLHDSAATVELSNSWTLTGDEPDPQLLLRCVSNLRPGRAVVGYHRGDLAALEHAGFLGVGPQVVWAR
jgi:hypothetical protein